MNLMELYLLVSADKRNAWHAIIPSHCPICGSFGQHQWGIKGYVEHMAKCHEIDPARFAINDCRLEGWETAAIPTCICGCGRKVRFVKSMHWPHLRFEMLAKDCPNYRWIYCTSAPEGLILRGQTPKQAAATVEARREKNRVALKAQRKDSAENNRRWSAWCPEFWIDRGLTLEEAKVKIKEIQAGNAKKVKNHICPSGSRNPSSLQSIAIRNNCTLEEAKLLTPTYGRCGSKHPLFGKKHSQETIKKIAEARLKEGRWGCVNKGYCLLLNGLKIWFEGASEIEFILWCEQNLRSIQRYKGSGIRYCDPLMSKERTYFPDFLVDGSLVVEVKGMLTATDEAKAAAATKLYGEHYLLLTQTKLAELLGFYPRRVQMLQRLYPGRILLTVKAARKGYGG